MTKAAIHPKEAIKGRATRSAGQLTKAEHPYLSREADDELLAANLQLREAQDSVNELDDERGATIASRQLLVDKLQARREGMKVAWTTARHVQRVRVVPKRHLKLPEQSSFVLERDESGKQTKFDRLRWLGKVGVSKDETRGQRLIESTRLYCTTHKISVLSMSTTLTISLLTPIPCGTTSSVW